MSRKSPQPIPNNKTPATISYEVEMELQDSTTLQLINLEDSRKLENMINNDRATIVVDAQTNESTQ